MNAPKKGCAFPGCCAWASGGSAYCATHLSAKRQQRGTRQQQGYGQSWLNLRPVILARDPLCKIGVRCRLLPIHKRVSTQVDHIIPIRVAPERRLDETNLQGCCAACNSWKRSEDERRWPSVARLTLRVERGVSFVF